jgi:hypothetical protein
MLEMEVEEEMGKEKVAKVATKNVFSFGHVSLYMFDVYYQCDQYIKADGFTIYNAQSYEAPQDK